MLYLVSFINIGYVKIYCGKSHLLDEICTKSRLEENMPLFKIRKVFKLFLMCMIF